MSQLPLSVVPITKKKSALTVDHDGLGSADYVGLGATELKIDVGKLLSKGGLFLVHKDHLRDLRPVSPGNEERKETVWGDGRWGRRRRYWQCVW